MINLRSVLFALPLAFPLWLGANAGPAALRAGESAEALLIAAAKEGNTEQVKALLDKGLDVNLRNTGDATLLMLAMGSGSQETAKLLIERGADVNYRTRKEGLTVLHCAVLSGNEAMTEILLSKGAEPDVRKPIGVRSRSGSGLELRLVRRSLMGDQFL